MIVLAVRLKHNVGQKMNGHTSNFKSWNLLWDFKYGLVMHDVGEVNISYKCHKSPLQKWTSCFESKFKWITP